MRTRLAALVLLAAAVGACVPYPAELLPPEGRGSSLTNIVTGAFPGLDAGYSDQTGLHFKVSAYGAQTAQDVLDAAEQDYQGVMMDTGLSSFMPRGLYQIVVYGSPDEYRKKTGQPEWSAGVTVGNAIYTFYGPQLKGVLAHEMTHLIWFEFMGGRLTDQQRWVNEGLAVYQESKAANRGGELFVTLLPTLRSSPIPMDQLQNLAPNSENGYQASLWYAEAESLVRFMIERGGRIGFAQFLTSIRDGQGFDAAVYAGFPGKWRTLSDVEADWKRSLL